MRHSRRIESIDRPARQRAASLVRRFAAGNLTNEELDDRYPESGDRAVRAVKRRIWFYSDDLREHRLTGPDRPTPEQLATLEQCALFLESERPYEWPRHPAGGHLPVPMLLFPPAWPLLLWVHVRFQRAGERACWPFIRREDLEAARGAGATSPGPDGPGRDEGVEQFAARPLARS
jgi:hypothetical protein